MDDKAVVEAAQPPRTRPALGGWLIVGALAITTSLWVAARWSELASPTLWPWRGAAQLVILWSGTIASLAILAVVRARALDPLFGGLGAAVQLHRRLGLTAFVLLGLHVLLLAGGARAQGVSLATVFVPFADGARTLDITIFYVLAVLGILGYDTRMRHERWLAMHRIVGVLFLFGTLHAAFEPGTIQDSEPLRTWIVILLIVGTAAWCYRVFFFRRYGPIYHYQVEAVVPRGANIVDLVMHPLERRMMYEPGTFVFIGVPSFKGREHELHPFSISSSPFSRTLRVSINQVGDFTKEISTLSLKESDPSPSAERPPGSIQPVSKPRGADVHVYGPFGRFTPHRFQQYQRMVWIASGIGITPFLSMLAFERSAVDLRRVWLYYIVRDASDAVYDEEIRQCHSKSDFSIEYVKWVSSEQGLLTAAQIAANVRGDYAVMICGSMPVVRTFTAEFRALGVPRRRIITEQLEFRGAPPSRPAPDAAKDTAATEGRPAAS